MESNDRDKLRNLGTMPGQGPFAEAELKRLYGERNPMGMSAGSPRDCEPERSVAILTDRLRSRLIGVADTLHGINRRLGELPPLPGTSPQPQAIDDAPLLWRLQELMEIVSDMGAQAEQVRKQVG